MAKSILRRVGPLFFEVAVSDSWPPLWYEMTVKDQMKRYSLFSICFSLPQKKEVDTPFAFSIVVGPFVFFVGTSLAFWKK